MAGWQSAFYWMCICIMNHTEISMDPPAIAERSTPPMSATEERSGTEVEALMALFKEETTSAAEFLLSSAISFKA